VIIEQAHASTVTVKPPKVALSRSAKTWHLAKQPGSSRFRFVARDCTSCYRFATTKTSKRLKNSRQAVFLSENFAHITGCNGQLAATMDDFASDTDSDYTSYWRDWVSGFDMLVFAAVRGVAQVLGLLDSAVLVRWRIRLDLQ
jgi:hypothetical protein